MQTLIFFRSQFCNFVFCKNSCLEIMPWYHGPCQWEIFYQILHTIPANIFIAWMNYATRINILRFNYEFMANLSETFWASKSVGCFVEKVFAKNSQNLQKNTCDGVLWRRNPLQVFSCEFFKYFQISYYKEQLCFCMDTHSNNFLSFLVLYFSFCSTFLDFL